MISKGFISEVLKCRRVSLGKAEYRYLNLIAAKPLSAYGVYLSVNKEVDIKNVRKTFESIHSKGLIEETGEKLPHNAKEYRLTSQGLFQYLLRTPAFTTDLKRYEEDIILKTILYQFFDVGTLDHFLTMFRMIRLNRYLRRCCQAILERIETYNEYGLEKGSNYFPEYLSKDFSRLIIDEIELFAFQIVINAKKKIPDFIFGPEGGHTSIAKLKGVPINTGSFMMIHKDAEDDIDDPNYQYAFPSLALANDGKFTKLLKEIKGAFNDGCEDLLYFSL